MVWDFSGHWAQDHEKIDGGDGFVNHSERNLVERVKGLCVSLLVFAYFFHLASLL